MSRQKEKRVTCASPIIKQNSQTFLSLAMLSFLMEEKDRSASNNGAE
jgi:hypothetical protein